MKVTFKEEYSSRRDDVIIFKKVIASARGREQDKDSEYYTAEIVDEGKDVRRKELEEEKARLLARIAEIDKELAAE